MASKSVSFLLTFCALGGSDAQEANDVEDGADPGGRVDDILAAAAAARYHPPLPPALVWPPSSTSLASFLGIIITAAVLGGF